MIFRRHSAEERERIALRLFEQHDLTGAGALCATEAVAALAAATGASLRKAELHERMSKYLRLRGREPLRLDFITFLNLINDIVDGVARGLDGGRGATYTDVEVLEIFQAFDTHRKGYIRRSDMIEALKHVLPSVSDDTLANIYERADPLRSGHITFVQFREILQGEALDYLEPLPVPDTLESAS